MVQSVLHIEDMRVSVLANIHALVNWKHNLFRGESPLECWLITWSLTRKLRGHRQDCKNHFF